MTFHGEFLLLLFLVFSLLTLSGGFWSISCSTNLITVSEHYLNSIQDSAALCLSPIIGSLHSSISVVVFFFFLYSASVTSTIPLPFEPILILSTCHNLGLFTHLYAFFRSVKQPHISYGVFSIICLARKSPLVVD